MGRLTVDRNAAGHDQLFHVSARAKPGLSQHLVELWRVIVCRQIAARTFSSCLTSITSNVFVISRTVECLRGNERKYRVSVARRCIRWPGAVRSATILLGAALRPAVRSGSRIRIRTWTTIRPNTALGGMSAPALGTGRCALRIGRAIAPLRSGRTCVTGCITRYITGCVRGHVPWLDIARHLALRITHCGYCCAGLPDTTWSGVASWRTTGTPERARPTHTAFDRLCIRAFGRHRTASVASRCSIRNALLARI